MKQTGEHGSELPHTEESALCHVKRASYQCFIWKHAPSRRLSLTPDGNGWTKETGNLVPKLEKDPAPESLLELIVFRRIKGCNARCSCQRVGLSCKAACTCEDECSNPKKLTRRGTITLCIV